MSGFSKDVQGQPSKENMCMSRISETIFHRLCCPAFRPSSVVVLVSTASSLRPWLVRLRCVCTCTAMRCCNDVKYLCASHMHGKPSQSAAAEIFSRGWAGTGANLALEIGGRPAFPSVSRRSRGSLRVDQHHEVAVRVRGLAQHPYARSPH